MCVCHQTRHVCRLGHIMHMSACALGCVIIFISDPRLICAGLPSGEQEAIPHVNTDSHMMY